MVHNFLLPINHESTVNPELVLLTLINLLKLKPMLPEYSLIQFSIAPLLYFIIILFIHNS